jgi:hypothetical protein
MAERWFILDSDETKLDAATAWRQVWLSLVVGFAVLAAAAFVALPPTRSAPVGSEAHHDRAARADLALVASSHRRD